MSIGKSSLARAAVAAEVSAPAAKKAPESVAVGGCVQIDTDSICPVKGEKLPSAAEEVLVASVTKHGVVEPLLLAQTENGLVLLAGARRLCAAKAAGLTAVPAVLRDMTAAEAAALRRHLRGLAAAQETALPAAEPADTDGITAVGQAMPDWLL